MFTWYHNICSSYKHRHTAGLELLSRKRRLDGGGGGAGAICGGEIGKLTFVHKMKVSTKAQSLCTYTLLHEEKKKKNKKEIKKTT